MDRSVGNQYAADKIVFHKSWTIRIYAAFWAVVVAGGYPIVFALPVPKIAMNLIGWFCFSVLEIIALSFAALFLYMAGPEDLSLDLNRHTYRYVFGWPLWPQVYEGQWEDMAGVYVWNMNGGRLSGYGVGIAWQENKMRSGVLGMKSCLLGTFDGLGRLDRANKMASEIATTLGLPLVDPPFPVRRKA